MQYTLKRLMDTKPELAMQLKQRCYAINGCCAAVHRELGPFLNEYMYQEASMRTLLPGRSKWSDVYVLTY